MFRLTFVLALTLGICHSSDVQAQNCRAHSHIHHYQPPAYSSGRATSSRWVIGANEYHAHHRGDIRNPYGYPFYGYGYIQDPYQTGSFRAPDLLDDPYFNARHKFDSHFPGRYSRRPPLEFRHPIQDPR
ncbi:secreted protein [Rhodopirellula maiorica SM1]|uniref:Secreted protein n=1 Tax=Rhodopirellula maiorica SM1 TaxID=1265738 RepID=M5RQW0_9BACT|nr:hypothetical protein [Rhodopirellula maiorica]EMI16329.1 secreted protein [Rhodopirellula maiorica SM1]